MGTRALREIWPVLRKQRGVGGTHHFVIVILCLKDHLVGRRIVHNCGNRGSSASRRLGMFSLKRKPALHLPCCLGMSFWQEHCTCCKKKNKKRKKVHSVDTPA